MSQIHITDRQTDQILDVIAAEHILTNKHYKSLKDTLETFHFETFADMPFSNYLGKLHNIIIPDEDGKYIEFIIFETNKYRSEDGNLITEVYSSASHQLLKKSKVIEPQVLSGQTPSQAVAFALYNTEWNPGVITYKGIKDFEVNEYTNPYSFLKRVAIEFNLELQFRVEVDGNKVTGRFVDLVPQVGEWQGREIEFGKDLRGVRRTEEMDGVVTALIGLGPVREDGTRLEALVEDREALERWGRNGQHLIETYEPESTNEDMTLARLTELTQNELQNRVNAVVEYQCDIADLESFPDMANKKIRCGDTIKIKDTKFSPPLYLEARVHTQERDIIDKSKKSIELGNFIEYTEAEVMDIWRSLQKQINFKIGQNQLADYTYDKAAIDDKDTAIYTDSKTYAFTKAQEAEDNAKEHADNEYAPIKNEVEENKNVWNRSGIINEDGTLNTDRLFGELTDAQIKSAGKWNAQGTYIDSEGVYTGLVVADKITSGTINADNVSITNDKVLINQDGVTIKDADFLVEDSISGIKSSIIHKDNYLKDGSFDFLRIDWSAPRTGDGVYDAIGTQSDITGWTTVGSPRVLTSYRQAYNGNAIFGVKTALLNNSNYLLQAFRKPHNINTFTFSFHYARHSQYNAGGHPRIEVEFIKDGYVVIDAKTFNFPEPATGVRRESFVINAPSDTEVIYFSLRTQNSRYVLYDGIQCTEGDTPIPFIPDSSLTYFTHGYVESEEIKVRRLDTLGVSSLNIMQANDDERAYFSFRTPDRERMGFMGFAHAANDNLTIRNDLDGEIVLDADIIRYTSPMFRIGGTVSGNQGLSRFEFWNSNFTTRWGRVGYFGSTDTILGIQNNVGSEVRIYGNFSVSGSKAAVVDTESYGTRKMYALETPDSRFVAYTEHVLEEGEHYIEIEPMFLETISPTDYFVVPHIQNAAEVVILERKEGKFRVWVQGHTAEVVFEVNGKRRGYEDVYMEESSGPSDEPEEGKEEEA
ncbi:phage tail spike protein [Salipaludibacillus agaradhaerens]|uniref:phage tail spike protein n=1 Tax=Salipaludibacillus agaradhaerens TaxID=76935 RepID=UPI000998E0EE|nr:phage tail spike protein [Salipaludibacillus agaradhaerens]